MRRSSRASRPSPEDIDVLFVGSVNERRLIVLKQLAAQGINVDARFNLYGAERDAFVARARIILNVHFYDARLFEIVRVSYLLANRKCVVSETGSDTAFENRVRIWHRVCALCGARRNLRAAPAKSGRPPRGGGSGLRAIQGHAADRISATRAGDAVSPLGHAIPRG